MDKDNFERTFTSKLNNNKFEKIKNNIYFQEEFKFVSNIKFGIDYYNYILLNTNIDINNKQNSFIMWVFDKTNILKTESGVIFMPTAGGLPDIDTDFQTSRRSEVIDYIRNKYGADKVCAVVTFGKLHGKSAIKAVLSAWEVCDHTQQKNISDLIQSKDKISDKLADFKDETGSDSILLYTLTHEPEALKDYVRLEEGKIVGEYAMYFELAIELEGSIKTESRHASAIIISDVPIYTVAPMIKDKNEDNLLCAFDMYSFELATLVKLDILALKSLDGLCEVNVLLKDLDIETIR